MKLSFSTIGCPEWDFGDILATAKDLGYDGIEIRGVGRDIYAPDVPQFSNAHIDATCDKLEGMGLAIPCVNSDTPLHRAPYLDRAVQEITGYMELASRIGCPYIRVLGDDPQPWPGAPVEEEQILRALDVLAPKAQQHGVTLLLETNGHFVHTDRLAALLTRYDHPSLAVLWDIHHPYRYGAETPEETWANIGKWVRHTHFKDSVLTSKVNYRMMGHGDLPIEETMGVLKDNGYDGFYSLEWVRRWDLTLEVPGIVFAQYASYMRAKE